MKIDLTFEEWLSINKGVDYINFLDPRELDEYAEEYDLEMEEQHEQQ